MNLFNKHLLLCNVYKVQVIFNRNNTMPSSTDSSSSSVGELPTDIEKQLQINANGTSATSSPEKVSQPSAAGSCREESEDGWDIRQEPDFLSNTDADGVAGAMNRVLSRISTKSSCSPGPPPDGGSKAWFMCELHPLMNVYALNGKKKKKGGVPLL